MYPEDEIEIFIEQYMTFSPWFAEREREKLKGIIMTRLEAKVDEAITNGIARWNRVQEIKRNRDNFFRVTRIEPDAQRAGKPEGER